MKKEFLSLAIVLGAAAFVNAQENYSTSWSQHRTYVLNTTASGANVPGNVVNFPVLVRLSAVDSAVFTAAKAGGVDLRFTKANNTTRLQHEIESWNATARTAAIWVKVDTVPGNATATLRMHWGNSGAADSSKGSAVFDTANGFEAVFHMNGALGDTLRDATINGYKGVPTVGSTGGSTAPKDTAGAIGSGKAFGGNNTDDDAGANTGGGYRLETAAGGRTNNSFNYMGGDAEFTLSTWTNFDAFRPTGNFSRRRGLITKASALTDGTPANADTALGFAPSNNDPLTQWYLRPNNVDRVMHVQRSTIPSGGTGPYSIVASGGVPNVLNNWNYVSYAAAGATANANRFRLYNSTGTTIREINDEPGLNKDVDVFIGALAAGAGSKNNGMLFLNGMMDEVRISKVARDSNWVNLEYANQKAGQTLLSVQVAGPPTALDYSSDTAAYALGIVITPNVATVTGAVDSFTVAPALPAGLALSKTTGAITGTPTAITAAANYVVTATNGFGSAKDTLRLSIVSAPPVINYASSVTYLVNSTIAVLSPSVTGSVDSFTVAPALPAGLTLHKTSGAISGAPTAASAAANYVITAAGATGTGKDTVSITVLASEDYTTWSRHKTLWLNTTSTGANVSSVVLNFPVLVRFTTTDTVYAQMLAGTADLRFTKSNNTTRLPHQVETWDSAGKSAAVWVLVDSVQGNNSTQTIRMHWGKAGTPNLSSGPAVFDTAKGFRAVFHFSERTNDTALNSTQYTFRGVPQRTATAYNFPVDTAGAIGRARAYGTGSTSNNSAGSYFTVNGSAAPLDFAMNGPYTLSLWAYVPETGTSRTMVSKSDRQYAFERRNTGADWEFTEHNLPLGGWQVVSTPSTANVWSHLIGVRSNGKSALYLDGVLMDTIPSDESNNTTTTARITTTDLNIGRSPDGGTNNAARYYWRGMLDEVRVANVSRSAAWAKLEFENQKAGQTLVSPTQPPVGILPGNARVNAHGEGLAAKAMGGGMLFQLSGAPQGGKLALMDVYGRTIWTGVFPAGRNHLVWNGTAANGQAVSGGVYLARVTLGAVNGKGRTLEMKVPFTR
jgi:hypothetical protein